MTEHTMTELTVGDRYRSSVCDTEVIILKAPAGAVDLACGGASMVPVDLASEPGGPVDADYATGTEVGKRYTDVAGTLEVLCISAGEGGLSLGGAVLEVKAATALPASD